MRKTGLYLLLFILQIVSACNRDSAVYVGIENLPAGLDPVRHTDIYEVQIFSQIYETLFVLKYDYRTVEANLVDNWEISEDHLNYRFGLKPDIRFHNGKQLTAADVLYSIRRYQNLKANWLLSDIIYQTNMIDSLTVEIVLKRPYALLLYALCSPYVLAVQTPRTIGNYRDLNPDLVGTGPFYSENVNSDGTIKLALHPNGRFRSGEVKEIRFVPFPNHSSVANALKNGDVDIIYMISSNMIDRLKWSGKINYLVNKPVNVQFIGFNNMRAPFNMAENRKAFLAALDIPRIVNNTNRGNAQVARSPLPPIYDHLVTTSQNAYHPDHARSVLKSLGADNDLTFEFILPGAGNERQILFEMIQTQLKKEGIHLELSLSASWDQHRQALGSDFTSIFTYGYDSEIIGDPGNFLKTLFHSQSSQNFLKYNNNHVDSLLYLAEQNHDLEKRNMLYREIVNIIIGETPAVFLNHIIPHFAYNSDKIKFISATPYQILEFQTMQLIH